MPFIDEVGARLVAQGVGVLGTTIGLGSKAVIPTTGKFLTIIITGGSGSETTQNDTAREFPTAQLKARGATYQEAYTLCKAAYTALGAEKGLYNITLSGVFYVKLKARQGITDTGLEEDRITFTFNIEAEKQPS